MSDVDCLTQIKRAVRALLEAGVPLSDRVLGPEDVGAGRPIPARWSAACLIVDIGDEDLTHIGREQGGTSALQERRAQVDTGTSRLGISTAKSPSPPAWASGRGSS